MRIRRREVTKRMSADSHILLPGHHVGQAQFIADAMHRNAGGSGSLGDADAGEFMSKRRVIIDDERLHVYEDGIWVALSPTEVRGIITSIDGMHAAGKPILMSSRDVSGILQCMMHIEELQAPNFFSEATEGAALSDCYLKVERTGSSCSIAAVEHSPEYRCAFSLNASSTTDDPAEFIRFLQTCYEGDADRSEKIMALQEFIGLTLVGMAHKISDARAILLQGQTMSGKSTIIEVIEELLPPGVITNMAPQEWIHTSQTNSTDFKMSQLRNARLNSLGELGDLRQLTSAENFKKIVTGDALSVRRSGKDGETIRVGAGIIMATNHSWSSQVDESGAFERRILILKHNRSLGGTAQAIDRFEIKRLLKNKGELSRVACWAIYGGVPRVIANRERYTEVSSSRHEMQKSKKHLDTFSLFTRGSDDEAAPVQPGVSVAKNGLGGISIAYLFSIWKEFHSRAIDDGYLEPAFDAKKSLHFNKAMEQWHEEVTGEALVASRENNKMRKDEFGKLHGVGKSVNRNLRIWKGVLSDFHPRNVDKAFLAEDTSAHPANVHPIIRKPTQQALIQPSRPYDQ